MSKITILNQSKAAMHGIFFDLLWDRFHYKEIDADTNGEVVALQYAKEMGIKYVYFCEELNKYYIFYRE